MSATHKEATEELRMAMKEAKSRLDTAIYGVIAYGVVTDAYENFMDQMETRYQLINKKFLALSASFRANLKAEEDQKLQMIKEERAEVKKERDERILEIAAREELEDNRATRKAGLIELELRLFGREQQQTRQRETTQYQHQPRPRLFTAHPTSRPVLLLILLPCSDVTGKYKVFILGFWGFTSHRKS